MTNETANATSRNKLLQQNKGRVGAEMDMWTI